MDRDLERPGQQAANLHGFGISILEQLEGAQVFVFDQLEQLALDPKAQLVVSSGFSDDPVLAEHREHGFCAALPKPYTVPRLQRLFEELAAAPVS